MRPGARIAGVAGRSTDYERLLALSVAPFVQIPTASPTSGPAVATCKSGDVPPRPCVDSAVRVQRRAQAQSNLIDIAAPCQTGRSWRVLQRLNRSRDCPL